MISGASYERLAALLRATSGLELGPGREQLVRNRLAELVARHRLASIDRLVERAADPGELRLRLDVCDAMTTGETQFFRDGTPFDLLRESLLPMALGRARAVGRPARVWSAASSSGQEAYSVAMLAAELPAGEPGALEIVASDFSPTAVRRVREGRYAQHEVQRGLPVRMLLAHFDQSADGYVVSPRLRGMVQAVQHNLLEPPDRLGQFDVVLCRNVLIYLDDARKRRVIDHLLRALQPGGVILLGGAESAYGVTASIQRVNDGPAAAYARTSDLEAVRREMERWSR